MYLLYEYIFSSDLFSSICISFILIYSINGLRCFLSSLDEWLTKYSQKSSIWSLDKRNDISKNEKNSCNSILKNDLIP